MDSSWHEYPIVVVDFETTGPDPEACQPVQVAAVRFEGGAVVAKRALLVKPGEPIPAEATEVHGITDEMVAGASFPGPALEELADIVNGAVPCGYNGQTFDRVIWDRFASSLGDVWIDPLVVVRGVDKHVPGAGKYRLANVCKRWGVALDNAHDALADAEATGLLLFSDRMRERLGNMTLRKLLESQEHRRREQDEEFSRYLVRRNRDRADAVWSAAYGSSFATHGDADLARATANLARESMLEVTR